MKGNEGPKGQNEGPKPQILEKERLQNLKNCNFRPGPGRVAVLEGAKGQTERK